MQSLAATGIHLERIAGIVYTQKRLIEMSGADDGEAISGSLLYAYYELNEIAKEIKSIHSEIWERERREKKGRR